MAIPNDVHPFSGSYYGSDGEVTNLMALGDAPLDHPINNMVPISGWFYASDGSIHNIDELSGGGGGTSGYTKIETNALIAEALGTAKTYTNEQIGEIINGSY